MGRALLIIITGFMVIFGNVRHNLQKAGERSADTTIKVYEAQVARNLAETGANIALSKLSGTPQWRDGLDTTDFSGGKFNVTITDSGTIIKLTSTGHYSNKKKIIKVNANFRPFLGQFAIYSTGDITNVNSLDEHGNVDSTLMVANADSLPDINVGQLWQLANLQGHFHDGDFTPDDGYPNSSFYFDDSTANIIYVTGDLNVHGERTVYGIYLVEGNIDIKGTARVEGVLYLLNPENKVNIDVDLYGGGDPSENPVTGGIIANGKVEGHGSHITVRYNREYMDMFASYSEDEEYVMEIISWYEL